MISDELGSWQWFHNFSNRRKSLPRSWDSPQKLQLGSLHCFFVQFLHHTLVMLRSSGGSTLCFFDGSTLPHWTPVQLLAAGFAIQSLHDHRFCPLMLARTSDASAWCVVACLCNAAFVLLTLMHFRSTSFLIAFNFVFATVLRKFKPPLITAQPCQTGSATSQKLRLDAIAKACNLGSR